MLSRRAFMKMCAGVSLTAFGSEIFAPQVAEGFVALSDAEKPNVVFIHGLSCAGCSVSLTYGNESGFLDFILRVINLQVHPTLSFSQGDAYLERMEEALDRGNCIVVVEGPVPTIIKEACYLGDSPLYDRIEDILQRASMVISSGTCASYGGIPASGENLTGAVSVNMIMEEKGVNKPHIIVPGCPVNPDRLMGTVAYIAATGAFPPLVHDKPAMYYKDLIHNHCSRHQFFTQDIYLKDFDREKEACLLKKGCRGTITYSDCPTRRWNRKTSVCVESNTPCVGCIHKRWPFNSDIYLDVNDVEDLPWSAMKQRFE